LSFYTQKSYTTIKMPISRKEFEEKGEEITTEEQMRMVLDQMLKTIMDHERRIKVLEKNTR